MRSRTCERRPFALTDCADVDGYYGFGVDLYLAGAEALLRRQKRATA